MLGLDQFLIIGLPLARSQSAQFDAYAIFVPSIKVADPPNSFPFRPCEDVGVCRTFWMVSIDVETLSVNS